MDSSYRPRGTISREGEKFCKKGTEYYSNRGQTEGECKEQRRVGLLAGEKKRDTGEEIR